MRKKFSGKIWDFLRRRPPNKLICKQLRGKQSLFILFILSLKVLIIKHLGVNNLCLHCFHFRPFLFTLKKFFKKYQKIFFYFKSSAYLYTIIKSKKKK